MEIHRPKRLIQFLARFLILTTLLLVSSAQRVLLLRVPAKRSVPPAAIPTPAQNAPQSTELPKPTVTPSPTPEPVVPKPARRLATNPRLPHAVLALEPLIGKYPWPVAMAEAIMACESGGNPRAASRTNDHGLFQIHNGLSLYGEQIYDPDFNIAIAYKFYYAKRGWQPWATYHNGCYKRYLS